MHFKRFRIKKMDHSSSRIKIEKQQILVLKEEIIEC